MISRGQLSIALLIALAVHAAAFIGFNAPTPVIQPPQATGVQIDLTMLGQPAPSKAPTQPEPLPEPVVEAPAPEPTPEPVAPTPPAPEAIAIKQKEVEKPKPVAKEKTPPKPERVVKRVEPKPKPAPTQSTKPTETVAKTQTTANTQTSSAASSAAKAAPVGVAVSPAVRQSYFDQIAAKLARSKRYPKASHRRGEEGEAKLAFVLDRTGNVLESYIVSSSGSARLDRAALDMLKRAQPLPPFPETLSQSTLKIEVPVSFRLRS